MVSNSGPRALPRWRDLAEQSQQQTIQAIETLAELEARVAPVIDAARALRELAEQPARGTAPEWEARWVAAEVALFAALLDYEVVR